MAIYYHGSSVRLLMELRDNGRLEFALPDNALSFIQFLNQATLDTAGIIHYDGGLPGWRDNLTMATACQAKQQPSSISMVVIPYVESQIQ